MGNQRDFFRLEFPPPDRPTLDIDGELFAVLDVSEQGMKILASSRRRFKEKMEVRGRIAFRDNSTCHVVGSVLRVLDDKSVVVLLTTGIPLAKMMEEQRRLIKKYKTDA